MNINALSHTHDPETSKIASRRLSHSRSAAVRKAIVQLLTEKPRTDDELIIAYRNRAREGMWPLLRNMHEIKRRRSDMHTRFRVVQPLTDEAGNKIVRPSADGNPSTVWTLSVSGPVALVIVATVPVKKDAA